MRCAQCGAQLRPGQQVCHMCGAPVASSWPVAPARGEGRPWLKITSALVAVGMGAVLCSLGLLGVAVWRQRSSLTAGQWLVFSSSRDDDSEIYLVRADGTDLTNLTNNPARDTGPAWSPDGTKIAFLSTRDRDHGFGVWVMNADGSGLVNLTPNGQSWITGVTWSPDGKRLALERQLDVAPYRSEIFVINSDGTSLTNITNRPNESDMSPVWSPDGSRIAFLSMTDVAGTWDIYTVRPDGSDLVRLTDDPAHDYFGSWSPDSARLLFYRYVDEDGDGQKERSVIWMMNADGSQAVALTDGSSIDDTPILSPDGQSIAFSSNRDGNEEIYAMDADGRDVTRLTDTPGDMLNWPEAWSPDGRQIVFMRIEADTNDDGKIDWDDDREIWVMNADGSGQTNISNNPGGYDFGPSWKP